MQQQQSLYEQLGGEEMVNKTVNIFYKKVLADARLKPFFENMDMARLEAMQRMFLCTAFGGPGAYSGRNMRRAHTHLVARGMGDVHFDAVLTHLDDTLAELHVSRPLRGWARALTESMRQDILCR